MIKRMKTASAERWVHLDYVKCAQTVKTLSKQMKNKKKSLEEIIVLANICVREWTEYLTFHGYLIIIRIWCDGQLLLLSKIIQLPVEIPQHLMFAPNEQFAYWLCKYGESNLNFWRSVIARFCERHRRAAHARNCFISCMRIPWRYIYMLVFLIKKFSIAQWRLNWWWMRAMESGRNGIYMGYNCVYAG